MSANCMIVDHEPFEWTSSETAATRIECRRQPYGLCPERFRAANQFQITSEGGFLLYPSRFSVLSLREASRWAENATAADGHPMWA